jgi:hypothetical protein
VVGLVIDDLICGVTCDMPVSGYAVKFYEGLKKGRAYNIMMIKIGLWRSQEKSECNSFP